MDVDSPETQGAAWRQVRRVWISHLAVVALLTVVCVPIFPLRSCLVWSGMILVASLFEGLARMGAARRRGRGRKVLEVASTVLTSLFYAYTAAALLGRGDPSAKLFGYVLLTSSLTFVLLRYYHRPWSFLVGIFPQVGILVLLAGLSLFEPLNANEPVRAMTPIAIPTLLLLTFWAARTHLARSWSAVLERERAAEAASKAKSEFLATMSHEIRTPLNGVLGMAQAMGAEDLATAQRERLRIIRRSGESLLAILDDVLDLSKIEAGRFELDVGEFDLEHMVRGAAANFAHVARQNGVAFEFEVDEAAKGAWQGDPACIRRVLYNLVSNAVKFTQAGEVRVAVQPSPHGLRIVVSDTGVGIAPAELSGLFDKFVQADASYTRRHGGAGLGLSVSRELVDLMGGIIEVDSALGLGSTFTVTLPLEHLRGPAVKAPPAEDVAAAGPDGAAGLRVLAAEDNKVNQMVLKTLLGQGGIEVVIVENGALAVEAWERGLWDIILMDIQMPELDGVSAARAIRAKEAEMGRARTPILAVTANAMTHQVEEYHAAGMDGVVPKPIDISKLFAAMEEALDGEPEATAAA